MIRRIASATAAFLRRLRKDRRGVSAVEFALIAPVMILFYFGMAELTQAMMAQRRNSHIASAIGDLVTQSSSVSSAEIADIFTIGSAIMKPFPGGNAIKIRVTSITVDNTGTAKVDWSDAQVLTPASVGAVIALPDGLVANGETVIKAESEYAYVSPSNFVMPSGTTFTETFYLRPRKSDAIARTQ
jgi:Flp pilus assembly protein TadG